MKAVTEGVRVRPEGPAFTGIIYFKAVSAKWSWMFFSMQRCCFCFRQPRFPILRKERSQTVWSASVLFHICTVRLWARYMNASLEKEREFW